MTLLIIGSTGTLGRQIVRRALKNGYDVNCLVRNIRKAGFLYEWGAKLVYGDLGAAETLPKSFKSITAVVDASTCRSIDTLNIKNVDWDGKIALLQAIKVAKIRRFVFFSVLQAYKNYHIPLMKLKYNIESIIQNSGITFTIFQLSGFLQGLVGQYALPILEQEPIFILPNIANETPQFSYMDTEDITIFCLKSFALKSTENKTYILYNPKVIISSKIIQICEKISGQKAIPNRLFMNNLKFGRLCTNFFQWAWNIADRLSFIELFLISENFNFDSYVFIKKTFNVFANDLLSVESYFQKYFEQILTKLKDLNYTQKQITKRRDLTL